MGNKQAWCRGLIAHNRAPLAFLRWHAGQERGRVILPSPRATGASGGVERPVEYTRELNGICSVHPVFKAHLRCAFYLDHVCGGHHVNASLSRGGKGGRRVVEVVRGPVWANRRSIITTVPAHGDLSPRARIILFFVFVWSIIMSTMAGAMQFSRGGRHPLSCLLAFSPSIKS